MNDEDEGLPTLRSLRGLFKPNTSKPAEVHGLPAGVGDSQTRQLYAELCEVRKDRDELLAILQRFGAYVRMDGCISESEFYQEAVPWLQDHGVWNE